MLHRIYFFFFRQSKLIIYFSIRMSKQQQPSKTKPIVKQQKPRVSKPSAIQQLPVMQDLLSIPEEEREERTKQLFEKVSPFLEQYAQKKIGSRVLQLIFKWGDAKVKGSIFNCIKKAWKDLIKSKYALYLIQHVVKERTIPQVADDAVLLQSTWEGARVLDTYLKNSGDQAIRFVKAKFYELWEKSKNGDIKAQQNLHNLSLKVIEKQYDSLMISKLVLRLGVGSMFAQQKQKVLQYLAEKVADWVGDEEGCRLFLEVINHSDPKLKKILVKSYKGHVKQIIELPGPTYVALIKAITQIDDTVFLLKTLQTQLEDIVPFINSNKHAFSIFFSLLSPRNHNFNILGKYEHTVVFTECKKEEQSRKRQIRKAIYPVLLNYLQGEDLYHILRHHLNNKLIIAVYKALEEDKERQLYNDFISKVATLFLQDARDAISTKTFPQCLAADPNANKILKQILLVSDEIVDYFCDEFGKLATRNLKDFLNTKASFVLLGLIEKGGRQNLLNQVKKNSSILNTAVAGQHYKALLSKK